MKNNYDGKYKNVEFTKVIDFLATKLPKENLLLLLKEEKIAHDQIHMLAMKQAYELYEQYCDNKLPNGTLLYKSVVSETLA